MNLIQTTGTTDGEGTLTLTLPLGRPNTRFEVAVVAQPTETANSTQATQPADPWAATNAFRERLAASGRVFTDSAELIREDRER
jgi:hypothetical protein